MDADAYPQEVLADEEPKYLRRQKPLEIKRRKFGRKAWSTYLRAGVWIVAAAAVTYGAFELGRFLLTSPEMALIHPEQVVLSGDHYVARASERRSQLDALPWIERATVRRALPNRIEVEITERTPIAFVRQASDMALVDVHGVILERPLEGNFHFPVVTGINLEMPLDDREKRMQLYSGFAQQIETVHAGALDQVSEVDLSAERDLRATLTGLGGVSAGSQADAPVLVHFGDSDFAGKYQTLTQDIGQWRAKAGPVESVDLRFSREAVVNQDLSAIAQQRSPRMAAAQAARKTN